MEFSTKQAWQDMRNIWRTVEWRNVIWFSQFNPRHAFILWLAIHEKLLTHDKIAKWKSNSSLQCALCKTNIDSHEHLFFQCHYSRDVWNRMGKLTCRLGNLIKLQDTVNEIANQKGKNNIGVVINKLVVAAVVYFLWQERNLRTFQRKERNAESVSRIVKESVRDKLLSIRVMKTKNVISTGIKWERKWINNSFVAN